MKLIRRSLTRLGEVTAHPAAFGLVLIYAGLWFTFSRPAFEWHAVATLATLFMTLVIQRAEHRDTQAMQAKLDELLRGAHSGLFYVGFRTSQTGSAQGT